MTEVAAELARQLAEAEARVERIRYQIAHGKCADTGHTWVFHGGRSACCADDCVCWVPVHDCAKCGDCDYGDNDEAQEIVARCAATDDGAVSRAALQAREEGR